MNTSDRIQPPRLKDSKKNLQQIAVTASSQVVAVDAQVRYRWVRIKTTVGVSFYFRSDSSGEVDQTLTTSLGSDSATLGYQLEAGTYEDFMLGGQDNYIVVEGSDVGVLQLLGSGPRRVVDGASAGP
jgi:hypothetical protein